MARFRAICLISVVVLIVILVFQNLAPMELWILNWHPQLAKASVIALSYLAGALTARPLLRWIRIGLAGKKEEPPSTSGPSD